MLTSNDQKQLAEKGISPEKLEWQLSIFRKGIPFIKIDRPATPGDGIISLSDEEKQQLITKYTSSDKIGKMKFVPASGAASRMFKLLYEYLEKNQKEAIPSEKMVTQFFNSLNSFAFYGELNAVSVKKGKELRKMLESAEYIEVLRLLLSSEGMNYGFLPKGLLKFHRYEDIARTPFEEHLVEAASYARSKNAPVKVHFTVSPEHLTAFRQLLDRIGKAYEERFGVIFEVQFSIQKSSTDTLAVDLDNEPFRNADGTLLFRPGGHGALLDNLNDLDADVIFIKNIDNVVPEKKLDIVTQYKKALAGKLLEIQEKVFALLREFDDMVPSKIRLTEIHRFIRQQLFYEPLALPEAEEVKNLTKRLYHILNRPIRVCGVVKNLGEPGGGPFWAPNSMGDLSLQIIESSQVNKEDKKQMNLFNRATHFNPVDLVCSTKSYKGEKFNLAEYTDQNTCFISQKSKDGKVLKALELPGLWNGAMADWITVFVEVPVETFNPVKTVNDLLRPEHQVI